MSTMDHCEFELENNDCYKKNYTASDFDVFVRVNKTCRNLVTLGIRINPKDKRTNNKKCNITFLTNNGYTFTKQDIRRNEQKQYEFYINLSSLKQLFLNSEIRCRIEVINAQIELPSQDQSNQFVEKKNKINEILTCIVCLELMTMWNILLCENGHSVVCDGCFKKLERTICPMCNSRMTRSRNFALEKIRDILLTSGVSNNRNGRSLSPGQASNENNVARENAYRYSDFNIDIHPNQNIGHLILIGIKKIYECIAYYRNWDHEYQRKFLAFSVFLLEAYVLFAVVASTVVIFQIQITCLPNEILCRILIGAFILNLSSPQVRQLLSLYQ